MKENKFGLIAISAIAVIGILVGYNRLPEKKISSLTLDNIDALTFDNESSFVDPNDRYGYKLTDCFTKNFNGEDLLVGRECTSSPSSGDICNVKQEWGSCDN